MCIKKLRLIKDTLNYIFHVPIVACKTAGGNKKNHPCVFPFIYKGERYQTCTRKDNNVHWCYTEVDSHGVGVKGKWGNCGPGCLGMSTYTNDN